MWSRGIKYDFLERLGEGGQGCVFKALRRDSSTGLSEVVALKVLHSETSVNLWKQEFNSLRRVRSPYCVQVLAFDRVRGKPSLVLEYVNGVPLSHLGRAHLLSADDIHEILAQIERGLLDLAQFDLFHGDLSPANVLVDIEGRVKLLDFGRANFGGVAARLTPDFAAPERLSGAQPSLASDLYSLGALECFLRNQPAIPTDQPHYLALNPSMRQPRGLKSKVRRRKVIAQKVALAAERARWSQADRTRTVQPGLLPDTRGRTPRSLAQCAVAALLLLVSPGAVPYYSRLPAAALLEVRTLKWHKIKLDDRDAAYAPLRLSVIPGRPVLLEWISATGQGRKILRPTPGQRIVLVDEDFTHPGGAHATAGGTPSHSGIVGGRADERRTRGKHGGQIHE